MLLKEASQHQTLNLLTVIISPPLRGVVNLHYHLILTYRCNLKCRYCGGTRDVEPKDLAYSIEDLKNFIEKDRNPVIAFYGGEPLLRIDLIEEIMDSIEAIYVLQTNGILLHKLDEEYLRRFHTILVSIDGVEEVTDAHRGRGVYRKVVENVRKIRERGFSGDLIARMTISWDNDIYRDVFHLINLKLFDHIHWQLDFDMFWEEKEEIKEFLEEYKRGVEELVEMWIEEMKNGKVLGLVPFIGVVNTLLKKSPKPYLKCGSGIDFFAISTNGEIAICPVITEYDFAKVGDIFTCTPDSIKRVHVGEPCTSCFDYPICGGRCLFLNIVKSWLGRNYALICDTVHSLISNLRRVLPEIKKLINNGIISEKMFEYPEINNGCEIIP